MGGDIIKTIDSRKLIGAIIGIFFFIVCVLSVTYAFYIWRQDITTINNSSINDIEMTFTTNWDVSVSGIGPVLDYTRSEYYTSANKGKYLAYGDFAVNNYANSNRCFKIVLDVTSISAALKDSSFKYVLLRDNSNSSSYSTIETEGNFVNFSVGSNVISSKVSISGRGSLDYSVTSFRLVAYIDGKMYNNSSMMNSSLASNIKLEQVSC